jgi:serine O-acetyltransferase
MNAVTLHRAGHWAYNKKIPLIPNVITLLMLLIYNSRISPSCRIGKGTKLAYKGMGVLIVSGAQIGENCSIGAGCKMVRKHPYKNVPIIGNNVYFGPGCVICGPVKIGDNVIVAANAVVLNSVHDGDVVGGIPARVLGNVRDLDYNILENPKFKEGWADFLPSKS